MATRNPTPAHGVYWLQQAMEQDEGRACPPLSGTEKADVCIIGGGYTGLWTAIEIKKLDPEASVVLLEADACGFGASGRNGGWATSWFDELDSLVKKFGPEAGLDLADRSSQSVRNIGELAEEHGFNCDFRPKGSLWVGTSPAHDAAIEDVAATCERFGRSDLIRRVGADEVFEMTGSEVSRGGLLITDGAAVQPAKLARGLRGVALKLGVTIHEGSPMIAMDRTSPARVRTSSGTVEADQVVLATLSLIHI